MRARAEERRPKQIPSTNARVQDGAQHITSISRRRATRPLEKDDAVSGLSASMSARKWWRAHHVDAPGPRAARWNGVRD